MLLCTSFRQRTLGATSEWLGSVHITDRLVDWNFNSSVFRRSYATKYANTHAWLNQIVRRRSAIFRNGTQTFVALVIVGSHSRGRRSQPQTLRTLNRQPLSFQTKITLPPSPQKGGVGGGRCRGTPHPFCKEVVVSKHPFRKEDGGNKQPPLTAFEAGGAGGREHASPRFHFY